VTKALRLGSWGFALGLSFMSFGYVGTGQLETVFPAFAAIGLMHALRGVILAGRGA